jgi:hypothetical protein
MKKTLMTLWALALGAGRPRVVAANAEAPTPLTLEEVKTMLLELLDLDANADDATIRSTFDTFGMPSEEEKTALEAANARRGKILGALGLKEDASEEEIETAVLALPGQVQAANSARAAAVQTAAELILDKAVADKRLTPAEKPGYVVAFNADFAGTKAKVEALKPALGTQKDQVDKLGGRKVTVANTQERQARIQELVSARMSKTGEDYLVAYNAVSAMSEHAALFKPETTQS